MGMLHRLSSISFLTYYGRLVFQTANLEHYTTYAESELIPIATIMLEYIITDPVQHESLYKKYAHKRYFRVCTPF